MTEILTFIADEIVDASALIWSGISIAIRLNYEVMSVIVEFAGRMIHTLLMLTDKIVLFFSILSEDILQFVNDVGFWAISLSSGLQALACGFGNLGFWIYGFVTYLMFNFTVILFAAKSSLVYCVTQFFETSFKVVNFCRDFFIACGESFLSALLFIPRFIQFVLGNIITFLTQFPFQCSEFVFFTIQNVTDCIKFSYLCILQLFSYVPPHTILGMFLGIALLVILIYIISYVIHNTTFVQYSINSVICYQKRIISYIQRHLHNIFLARDDIDREEIVSSTDFDEFSDENGNDNNSNVLNQNTETDPNIVTNNTQPSSSSNIDQLSPFSINNLIRQPIRGHRRSLGLRDDITEDEVLSNANDNSYEFNNRSEFVTQNLDGLHLKENQQDGVLCIICEENSKHVALLPCRHLCLCEKCYSSFSKRSNICPICRNPIEDTLRVFL